MAEDGRPPAGANAFLVALKAGTSGTPGGSKSGKAVAVGAVGSDQWGRGEGGKVLQFIGFLDAPASDGIRKLYAESLDEGIEVQDAGILYHRSLLSDKDGLERDVIWARQDDVICWSKWRPMSPDDPTGGAGLPSIEPRPGLYYPRI